MSKKGQIAIFVIVALVIVGVVIAFFASPGLREIVAPREISPTSYLEDCISPEVKTTIELLSKQGGEENPTGYVTYNDVNVKYLCYVEGFYKTCVIQQPLLITSFGKEISRILTPKLNTCAQNMKTEYERRGYNVDMGRINSSVDLAPGKIEITFNIPMTITREDSVRTFEKIDVAIESEIYDLLSISTSIVDYEATYGDSETTLYLQYYPSLKIEKIKLENGIKIYKVSDVVTEESFTFAIRSLVWPAGYGLY